jgi:hypothetical protein
LIRRNKQEFAKKTAVVKLTTPSGIQGVTVINYHGVIRVAMLSDAPRAAELGDFVVSVLYPGVEFSYTKIL